MPSGISKISLVFDKTYIEHSENWCKCTGIHTSARVHQFALLKCSWFKVISSRVRIIIMDCYRVMAHHRPVHLLLPFSQILPPSASLPPLGLTPRFLDSHTLMWAFLKQKLKKIIFVLKQRNKRSFCCCILHLGTEELCCLLMVGQLSVFANLQFSLATLFGQSNNGAVGSSSLLW